MVLQHEKELRDLQAKADADFKKYQAAESAANKASQRHEALAHELRNTQDQSVNEKAALEKRLRDLQELNARLTEEASDAQAQLSDQQRHCQYQIKDIEAKRSGLQQTVDQVKFELGQLRNSLDAAQSRLAQRDSEVEQLEAVVADLKSQPGNSGALAVVQRELTEQVSYIRKLETTNHEQLAELRRLRDTHRSVQLVEEQKHALETELHVLKDVHRQLGEALIQKDILEDEKRTWTSLLEQDNQLSEFQSPEAVVKAFVKERIEHVLLVERLGQVESDVSEKDEIIKSLEAEKLTLKHDLEQSKHATSSSTDARADNKAYRRLERQRILAVKEVDYLRAQLKAFDLEETVLMENQNFDSQRARQMQELESLVDQYRAEIQELHEQLSKQEEAAESGSSSAPRGTKRPATDQDPDGEGNAQLGPLLRKNKNLQVALQKMTQQSQLLATELQAAKSQLKSLRASSQTRILELRDNPTASAEAIKMSTLATLKRENADLLHQLRGEDLHGVEVVPVSVADALKLDLAEMEKVVAEKEKRMRRLREIWTDKAAEFRDVIASVLGYQVTFLPNGKVKVSSMFYGQRREAGDESRGAEDEHFIMFDGENGTMKISGGSDGQFGQEIKNLVDFWVKDKKEIPCFLAAMTLEFYERFSAMTHHADS